MMLIVLKILMMMLMIKVVLITVEQYQYSCVSNVLNTLQGSMSVAAAIKGSYEHVRQPDQTSLKHPCMYHGKQCYHTCTSRIDRLQPLTVSFMKNSATV